MEGFCGVVFDVDDTAVLAGVRKVESLNLRRSVAAARRAGFVAIAATGRDEINIRDIIGPAGLNLDHECPVANGAYIMHPGTGEITWECLLAEPQTEAVIDICKEYPFPLLLPGDSLENLKHASDQTPRKVSSAFLKRVPEAAVPGIQARLAEIDNVYVYAAQAWNCGKGVYDIAVGHIDAQKENALKVVLDRLEIDPKRMVGVGDGYNDVKFLEMLGYVFAVANAKPEVLAIANEVVSSCENDGLAEVFWRFSGGPRDSQGPARHAP